MARGRGAVTLAATLVVTAAGLAACGGRFHLPSNASGGSARSPDGAGTAGTHTIVGAGATQPTPSGGRKPSQATSPTAIPPTTVTGVPSSQTAIAEGYQVYLKDLSGLDDTLSQGYLAPLASVTTTRLGQASARQAAAILAAHEHGVGTLRDAHLAITMTGPASAALAACQDDENFYLVSDGSGTPDPFVQRGYFVDSAQLLLQDQHWLVDTFTTTHIPCTF